MKQRILVILFLISSVLSSLLAQPTAPEGKQWKVMEDLTDEFDSWDSNKWMKSLWNYGVPVQMLDKNSGVNDGKLWIKATLDEGAERWFETSRVMSKTQIKFPMYIECSMLTAHISAYNTFWLNNGNISNRDEIDICENNSKPTIVADQSVRPWTMYSQYFIVENDDTERSHGNFDNRSLLRTNPLKGVAWNEAYHTLGMWWIDENNVQFYLDGEEAGSVSTIRSFTLNQSVIWDLWTYDATWNGGLAVQADLLDDSINTMYVDWIHTYTLEDAPTALDANQTMDDVKVFANVNTDALIITFADDLKAYALAQIYNNAGQLLSTTTLSEKKNQLSLNAFSSGIYHLRVVSGNESYSHTFIK